MKLSAEQLETRDVPAIFLTETTTFTNAITGGIAQVTVDDVNDAGQGFRWNYHLENVSVNYDNSGGPAVGIGFFDLVTATGAVNPLSVTTPAGWSVFVGDFAGREDGARRGRAEGPHLAGGRGVEEGGEDVRQRATLPPRSLAVFPDGKGFVSGGTDTTALIWKLDPK